MNSTTLTSLDEALASSLTAANVKLMVEFADVHDSGLESLIDDLKAEVERLQELKGTRWLDDFVHLQKNQ